MTCVRSFELLSSGVHFSVSSSPRLILVGTVSRAAASVVRNSVLTQQLCENFRRGSRSFGLQSIARDGPHKWFRSFTEVLQARETSCAEEYKEDAR